MRLIIEKNYDDVSLWAAYYVASEIKKFNPTPEHPFVLGLPTGSSPLGMYRNLARMVKRGELSFKNVVTFNMDEYCGLPEDHPQSYHAFMWDNFFSHIDIDPENVNILDGNADDLTQECLNYEAKIKNYGGIDLFVCGVGADGHIAFNEPGSSLMSRTRRKTLAHETVLANARFFDDNITMVPKVALTVGVGTVIEAKKLLLLANGQSKARAIHHGVEEGVSQMWTITALQLHPDAIIVADEDACSELRVSTYRYFKDIESENLDPMSLLK